MQSTSLSCFITTSLVFRHSLEHVSPTPRRSQRRQRRPLYEGDGAYASLPARAARREPESQHHHRPRHGLWQDPYRCASNEARSRTRTTEGAYPLDGATRSRMTARDHQVSWFIAPTVALVEQQAEVIRSAIPVSVGTVSGSSEPNQWKDASLWRRILASHRIMVSTPQVLLDALHHVRYSYCMLAPWSHHLLSGLH